MEGHAEKGVERYCELAKKGAYCLQQVATPSMDDHHIPPEDYETTRVFFAASVQNCHEMLVDGEKWTTRFIMVS